MSSHAVRPKILGFISEEASAWLVAMLVLLLGGLLTLLLAVGTRDLSRRQLQQRFELLASERFSRIEERFEDQEQRLDSLRRFFINSDSVSRREVRRLCPAVAVAYPGLWLGATGRWQRTGTVRTTGTGRGPGCFCHS